MLIKGTIENIELRKSGIYEKKVITLVPDHRQKAYVEVRDYNMHLLHGIKENDEIEVVVMLEGKVSKNSGVQFNNLVVQELKKIS